jgi:hypothetical protein
MAESTEFKEQLGFTIAYPFLKPYGPQGLPILTFFH